MMEKRDFRDNLELVLKASGGDVMLRIPLVAEILGIDPRTVMKIKELPIKKAGRYNKVSAVAVARYMS